LAPLRPHDRIVEGVRNDDGMRRARSG
jgi:hypothetical protein